MVASVVISVVWPYVRQLQQQHTESALSGVRAATQPANPAPQTEPVVRPVVASAPAPSSEPQPPLPPANPPAIEIVATHKLGEVFTIGAWEYRATGRRWQETLGNPAVEPVLPATGRIFLTVYVVARNISHEMALLPKAVLLDQDGARYEPEAAAGMQAETAGQPVALGAQQVCSFTFEVPSGGRYRILLPAGWLSHKCGSVKILP